MVINQMHAHEDNSPTPGMVAGGGIEEVPTEMTALAFYPDRLRKSETLRRNIKCPESFM